MDSARHLCPTALVAAIVLAAAGCTGTRNVSDRDIESIDLEGLMGLIDHQNEEPGKHRLLLLDSRPDARYAGGHIPNARHLQTSDINAELGRDPAIDAYDDIVVYADNPGSASAKALAKLMMSLRYDGIRWFAGGLDTWSSAGLPVAGSP
ncbi:MAG: rhodanese-like domain-containing protein [Phycisphaeraceae bacterium]|nr:MAG: rhodanese-like domain-containing protein [Phycisphaeraceae bacterium]